MFQMDKPDNCILCFLLIAVVIFTVFYMTSLTSADDLGATNEAHASDYIFNSLPSGCEISNTEIIDLSGTDIQISCAFDDSFNVYESTNNGASWKLSVRLVSG